ncbi:D-alanyl-D-alanine carboxypeptidase/D-alanyl-D-alanine-endopeptidase [Pedobacter antarcticus]|uniref:D-alanyl-D-alanine carboxypeptidase/D-alanyl-D-alanine endopeptidase n=1 Tax=Pedobacter antarcticus TaxID=34086 RepID=UPI00292E11DF|nr:D-alanyl-D-alanine carboxypeptidase/D-alanyl-D-alanine-endopeptidase [Pedobacter antarcticus]
MFKNTSLLFLLFLQYLIIFPKNSSAQTEPAGLAQAFERLSSDPQAKYAITSICVLDGNTGKQLYGRNENIGVATASTLKTITSATAFALLGKDFRYQTLLKYTGSIDEKGVLHGNLIISGGGDPTLGSDRYQSSKEPAVLDAWVQAIKKAGITKIDGQIIGDASIWGTQGTPDGWTWQDMGNYYGAGSSALSWRENQFDIKLKPGSNVLISRTIPEMPYLKIVNELKGGKAGSGDNAYVFLPPYSQTAYLRGTWATDIKKSGISAAIPDPAYEAAFRLADTLKRIGIISSNSITTDRLMALNNLTVPAGGKTLAVINSPALPEMVYWLNKKSINLYAENLLKTLAWKAGKEATTENGATEVIRYWSTKGIDRNALNILDGSGLSPANRVTASAMAQILYQIQKENWYPHFYESLPVNNGMKLKSGTIKDVSAFAGYYESGNGKRYVIVININNYSGSGINNKLFNVLNSLK